MSLLNHKLVAQPTNSYEQLSSLELDQRIAEAKRILGTSLVILGHHYQRDDVIQYADFRGDSLQLARLAAQVTDARYIVFCGVHFMAETADLLTSSEQIVILPDLRAGCSMADMATSDQVDTAWDLLTSQFGHSIMPITYVNSSAAVKAFVGRHDGLTVTSSNAQRILQYALQQSERVLFLPDQHLGRNTAVQLGIDLHDIAVYDPSAHEVQYPHGQGNSRVLLWKGHCSVHEKFQPHHVTMVRQTYPDIRVIVHPECSYETVQLADDSGSTDYIIKQIEASAPGTSFAIGTEHHLVHRLADTYFDRTIVSLNENACPCMTMNRIDRPHLLYVLEQLVKGSPTHIIRVSDDIATWSRIAIERMLQQS
ncbi:MAG: quinolinate synthase NadA [Acidibacillus sp.]|nr:quinolinate synthase NadA [Acidibacillus sp.]